MVSANMASITDRENLPSMVPNKEVGEKQGGHADLQVFPLAEQPAVLLCHGVA